MQLTSSLGGVGSGRSGAAWAHGTRPSYFVTRIDNETSSLVRSRATTKTHAVIAQLEKAVNQVMAASGSESRVATMSRAQYSPPPPGPRAL